MATEAEFVEPVSTMEYSSGKVEQIMNEFSLEELKKSRAVPHQPPEATEIAVKLGSEDIGCKTEDTVRHACEGHGRTLEGESFSESHPSAKVNVEGNEAENKMLTPEKQLENDGPDEAIQKAGGEEEKFEEEVSRKSCIKDTTETILLAKIDEAKVKVIEGDNAYQETSTEEFAMVIGKEVSALEMSAEDIEPERPDQEYGERNPGESEGANTGASLVHSPNETKSLSESNEMKDAKPVEDEIDCKSEPAGLIEPEVQTPLELQNSDTIATGFSPVDESNVDYHQEEANDSNSNRSVVLDFHAVEKHEEGFTEQSKLDIKKPEGCIHSVTEELRDAEATLPIKEETPTLSKVDVAEEIESPLSMETKIGDEYEASKSTEIAAAAHPSAEKDPPAADEAAVEKLVEEKEATVQKETRAEKESMSGEDVDSVIAGKPSDEKNLLLIEEVDQLNNGQNDTEAKRLDEIMCIESKERISEENGAAVSKGIQIGADESEEVPVPEKEYLPLIQEAGELNSGVDGMETDKMIDISSFKTEELVEEKREVHEAKETQAEDKTDASGSTEIAFAGHSSTDQQNLLQSHTEEEIEAINVEAEKLDEISDSEPKEQENGYSEAPKTQKIQAKEEFKTPKDSEGMISEHSSTEKEQETNQGVAGDKDTKEPMIEETSSAEELGVLQSGTDVANSSKEAPEEHTGIQAKEDSLALAEQYEITHSEEDVQADASKETAAEPNLPLPVDVSRLLDEEAAQEEPLRRNPANFEEVASPKDEVGTINEVSEAKSQDRSTDTPIEEIDARKEETSKSDEGAENVSLTMDDVVEEKTKECGSDEPLTAASDKHAEMILEKPSTEVSQDSLTVTQEKPVLINTESVVEVQEVQEVDRSEMTEEIPMQMDETHTVAAENSATVSEQAELGEDVCIETQIQSKEHIHKDVETWMKNEAMDMTNHCKTDATEQSDENSSNQKVQMDVNEYDKACEEALDNTESLPTSLETEKIVLEESLDSKIPDGESREDYKLENITIDLKLDAGVGEEVIDPADVGKEISCADESRIAYNANTSTDQECIPSEMSSTEIKEQKESTSENEQHETAIKLTQERDDTEEAAEDEKEMKLQREDNLESSLAAVEREEKCSEEEDMQTNGAPKSEVEAPESPEGTTKVEDEANVHGHEGTMKPEIHEHDSETSQEAISEAEAGEVPAEFGDATKQVTSEEITITSEPKKQSEKTNGANDSIDEKVSCEEDDNAEILMRNATTHINDQGKSDETKVSYQNSLDQDVQMDNSECEKVRDEASEKSESLFVSSETDKISLEESSASKNPNEELEEDNKPEYAPLDSISGGDVIEKVTDPVDAGEKIRRASGPAPEDQSYEALSGTKEDMSQKSDESRIADDANKVIDLECIPNDMSGEEKKEKMESPSETERCGNIDEPTEAIELTKEYDDTENEKAVEDDKELKIQRDVNLESFLVAEVREEKCLDEEAAQTDGAPKSEIQEKDSETVSAVISETEARDHSTVLEGAKNQPTSEELAISSEPEKQCEKTSEVNDPIVEKVLSEEVDDGEEKSHGCESSKEQVINEVANSEDILAPSPVESITVEEGDSGLGSECTEVKVENVHAEEITTGRSECESTSEDFETEKIQEHGSFLIPQTEDAGEEVSSNSMCQQSVPEREKLEKEEAAVDVSHIEYGETKAGPEEVCSSKHPETEAVDAVEETIEEEKSKTTASAGEIDGTSREVDVSDSQFPESVSGEEITSGRSCELEAQILTPGPVIVPENEENETAAVVEDTNEENETGEEMQQHTSPELSSAAEVTKEAWLEKEERAIHGDTEANEGRQHTPDETDGEGVPKGEDSGQADKLHENIIHEKRQGDGEVDGDVDGSESTKRMIREDSISEKRHCSMASTDIDEAAAHGEQTKVLENKGVSTSVSELSTKEEQDIQEEHDEQKVVSEEQAADMVEDIKEKAVTESVVQENESLELSSAVDVKKEGCIVKDNQNADSAAANEAAEDTTHEEGEHQSAPVEDLKVEPSETESSTEYAESPATAEKSAATSNTTDLSQQNDKMTQEATSEIQMEEKFQGSVDSGSWSLNAEEVTIEADKQHEIIIDEKHRFDEEVNVRESMKQVIEEDRFPEKRYCSTTSTENDEAAAHGEQAKEVLENKGIPTEQDIPEEHDEQKVISKEKYATESVVQESESLVSSSAADVKKEAAEDIPHEEHDVRSAPVEALKVEPLETESGKEYAESPATIGESTETSGAADLSPERAEMTQAATSEIQMEDEFSGSVDSESRNLNVEQATIEADKQRENIIDEKHHGDGEVDGRESIKHVIKEDSVPETKDCSSVSAEYDEAAVHDEPTKEEILETKRVSASTSELSIKEEQDISKEHDEEKVVSMEQSGTTVEVIKEEDVTDSILQENESLKLSSSAEVTKEDCIEKDKQVEDIVSAATEATEDTRHEEDEDRSAPVEAQKLDTLEKESETENADSTIEKSLELIVETETISDLMSQRSEVTENVEAENQTEENTLGPKDSEIRSSISEEETVEVGKQDENAIEADGVIQDKISDEKDDGKHGKSHDSEGEEDTKATREISRGNLKTSEEGDFGIVPAQNYSVTESFPILAEKNIDEERNIASDVLANVAEECVEQVVPEKIETSYDESNAANMAMEATDVNSGEAEHDQTEKESAHEILAVAQDIEVKSMISDVARSDADRNNHSDNALEAESDNILYEEENGAFRRADESASIKEEVMEKGRTMEESNAACKERDSSSVPAEDIAAEDLPEQTQDGNLETDANPESKSESSVKEAVESGKNREDTKVPEDVKKEILEEADSRWEKIDSAAPEISPLEAQEDEKPEKGSNIDLEQGSQETESSTEYTESPATAEKVAETSNATDLSQENDKMTQETTSEIQMEDKFLGSVNSGSWNLNVEEVTIEADKQHEIIIDEKHRFDEEVNVRESIKQVIEEDNVPEKRQCSTTSTENDEAAVHGEQAKEVLENKGIPTEQDIPEEHDEQRVISEEQAWNTVEDIKEKDLTESVVQESESLVLSSAADVKKEECIDKDDQSVDAVTANEAAEGTRHEERDDRSAPVEALKVEPSETKSGKEHAESPATIGESAETSDATDLSPERAEMTQAATAEIQMEEEFLGSVDSESRDLNVEQVTIEADKQHKNIIDEKRACSTTSTENDEAAVHGEQAKEVLENKGIPTEQDIPEEHDEQRVISEEQAWNIVEDIKEKDLTESVVQESESLVLSSAADVKNEECIDKDDQTVDAATANEAAEDTPHEERDNRSAPVEALKVEPLETESEKKYAESPATIGESTETSSAADLSPERAEMTQAATSEIQMEEEFSGSVDSESRDLNVEQATIEADKQHENIIDEKHHGDGEIDGRESIKQVIEEDSVPETKDCSSVSAEYDEAAVHNEPTKEEILESKGVSASTSELSIKEEQDISKEHDEEKVVSVEQSGTIVEDIKEEDVTDSILQENESLQLSSSTEVTKEDCIEKDKQVEDIVSAATEATEDTQHEEDEDRSGPVEALKLDTLEKRSEVTENVKAENQTEENTLGPKDSEIRSSISEDETVEVGKQDENAIEADGVIQDKISDEKDDGEHGKNHDSEGGEDTKATREISSGNLKTSEEGDFGIVPAQDYSVTEDTGEVCQLSVPEQEKLEKEEAATDVSNNEYEEAKAGPEEVCSSKHLETEAVDAVEETIEEEKSKTTASTGEIEGTSWEMDVSDSQFPESVSGEETTSGRSRELEAQILTPGPIIVPEIETAAVVEDTNEENETGEEMQQNTSLELSSAAEVTKEAWLEKEERAIHGDTEANEGRQHTPDETDGEGVPKGEDSGQADKLHENIIHEKRLGDGEVDGDVDVSESTKQMIQEDSISEKRHCSTMSTEIDEATAHGEQTEVLENKGFSTSTGELSTKEEQDIQEEHDDQKVVSEEQAADIVEVKEKAVTELVVQENKSLELSSAVDLKKEECIVKDNQNADSAAAREAPEDTPHEEGEDWSAPVEDLKVEPSETESGTGYAESPATTEKSAETSNATDLSEENDKMTQEATSEIQMEEKFPGSVDSESRNLNIEEVTIEADKQHEIIIEKKHRFDEEVSVSESMKQVIEEDSVPETDVKNEECIDKDDQTVDAATANEAAEDTPHEERDNRSAPVEALKVEPLETESGKKYAESPATIGESTETSGAADLSPERAEMTQAATSEIQMEEEFSGSVDSESRNLNVEQATIEADKQHENIIDKKHHGDGEVDGRESIKQVIEEDSVLETKDCSSVSAEYDEAAVHDEPTKEEILENKGVSESTSELSIKEERDISKEHGEEKVVSMEQSGTTAEDIEEEDVTDSILQENESLQLSSSAEVTKEDCIEKDKQVEDIVSAATEATEDPRHEEDEDRSASVEALKLDTIEKESETENADSTIEKRLELIVETETTSDLISQRSEVTENVEAENQTEENTLGPKDSEIRSSISEEETVEVGKQDENAIEAEGVIQDKISDEKDDGDHGRNHDSEGGEDTKATNEISRGKLNTSEEGDFGIVPAQNYSVTESSPILAEKKIDDENNIASDVLANDAEECVEEVVPEKIETSYDDSNAANMAMEATDVNSGEAEHDQTVKESAHEILAVAQDIEVKSMISDAARSDADPNNHSDNALESKRDNILYEEENGAFRRADESASIKEEVMEKGCTMEESNAARKERDSSSVPAEDIAAEDLPEQTEDGNIETAANPESNSESSVKGVVDSDKNREDTKVPEDVKKEILEEADSRWEKIDPAAPEISLPEAQEDEKPVEQSNIDLEQGSQETAKPEITQYQSAEEIEGTQMASGRAKTSINPVEATYVIEETTVEDTDVAVSKFVTEGIPGEVSLLDSSDRREVRAPVSALPLEAADMDTTTITEEIEETMKEVEQKHNKNLELTSAESALDVKIHEVSAKPEDAEVKERHFEVTTGNSVDVEESKKIMKVDEISLDMASTEEKQEPVEPCPVAEEITEETRQENELKDEEVKEEETETLKSTVHELQNQDVKDRALDEARAQNEADRLFVEIQEVKKSFPKEEEGNTAHEEVAELNTKNEKSEINFGKCLPTESTSSKEEELAAQGKADENPSIEEEVINKSVIAEEIHASCQERETSSVPAEVIAAKYLNEQTKAGNPEAEANPVSKSESSTTQVVENDESRKEQISIPMEETEEVKDVEKEIPEEADPHCKNIGPAVPEIGSLEAQWDEKPVEQSYNDLEQESQETAETKARLGDEEIEEALSKQIASAEEFRGIEMPSESVNGSTDSVEAPVTTIKGTTAENMNVAGSKLESRGIPEEVSVPESSDTKRVELRHNENLELTSVTEVMEEVDFQKAEEVSARATQSVSTLEVHEVFAQLEDTAINEKHFEVETGNSAVEEQTEKVIKANDISPDIAFGEEPVYPFVQEQESDEPHPVAQGITDEIHRDNILKEEEVKDEEMKALKTIVHELQYQEDVKDHVLVEGRARDATDLVFVEEHESKKSSAHDEEGNPVHEEVAELNVTNSKNSSTKATTLKKEEKNVFQEGALAHKEFGDIHEESKQEEDRISAVTQEGANPSESSPCEMMATVVQTGKVDALQKADETVAKTLEKPEESILVHENPLDQHGGEEVTRTLGRKACEEPASTDMAAVSPSDPLKDPSATENLQVAMPMHFVETRDAMDSSLEMPSEGAKKDEEKDEANEDKHRRPSPEQDTPVMVESSKDIEVKGHHKKSHNILSGVGSRVKHSISKVKKAITGKSSHSKLQSPKQSS
ncbi:uncharacterized protein LOC116197209 isoform X2 [Punica granatum]|uniref:Uncharacterized protein LOC116197209 isoform X2 n=1 Tax=Punica granatum TaxID=22663 RepID=A0A6P8CTS4_PUNGR|nr:uncharacterized protein LOC116197209 isoform X2 [Punica granatum]